MVCVLVLVAVLTGVLVGVLLGVNVVVLLGVSVGLAVLKGVFWFAIVTVQPSLKVTLVPLRSDRYSPNESKGAPALSNVNQIET